MEQWTVRLQNQFIIIITDREVLSVSICYWSGCRGFFFRRFD